MTKYSRVSYAERCQIFALLQSKISIINIANQLGLHRSTIYREIKRNRVKETRKYDSADVYRPIPAQRLAINRFKFCRRKLKIDKQLEPMVVNMLRMYFTPEQISGRIWREKKIKISHQSIYNFIRQRSHYSQYLCYRGIKHYRHQRNNTKRNSDWTNHISKRPHEANIRSRIGHWERDLMYAKDRAAILVCTDRKSRFTKIKKIPSATISDVSKATHELLESVSKKVISVTNDNGPEFRAFNSIKYPTFFCDPYKPQQRGTIENTIGVVRRFIKSKTDITTIDVDKIETWLNLRPRKILDYQTPFEVLYKRKVALVI